MKCQIKTCLLDTHCKSNVKLELYFTDLKFIISCLLYINRMWCC